jgi:hypothetical protein
VLGGSLGGLGDTALMLTIAWQGVGFVLMGVLVALTLTREDPLPAEEPAAAVEAPTGAPGDVPVDLPTTR